EGPSPQGREPVWEKALMMAGGVAFDSVVRRKPAMQPKLYKGPPAPAGFAGSRLFHNHNWEIQLLLEKPPAAGKAAISAKSIIKNANAHGRSLPLVNEAGRGLRLRISQSGNVRDLPPIEGQLLPFGASTTFGKLTTLDDIDLEKDFELEE